MLIIKCYGLEEDRVTYLSKISTDDLKKIYGSDDNEIVFTYSGSVIKGGLDQTDYHAIVEVNFPGEKRLSLGNNGLNKICKTLLKHLSDLCIHATVLVRSYQMDETVFSYKKSDKYPMFLSITDENGESIMLDIEDDDECECDCDENCECHHEGKHTHGDHCKCHKHD